MTSGVFTSVDINSIWVNRGVRQRKELLDIEALAETIHRTGLIHPPVIKRDGELIAGERRWTACKSLGWTSIPVQYVDDLSRYELSCIEFEENVKRKALTWQEEADAIAAFHALKSENEESWTREDTAEALGLSRSVVNRNIAVAEAIVTTPEIAKAEKLSSAVNLVERSTARRKSAALAAIDESTVDKVESPQSPILHANFHEWQPNYTGPRFNLIHCDFPYGINVANSPRQNAAMSDYYEDGKDVYFALLRRLSAAMDNVVAETAHLIFWFSMDYYTETLSSLTSMGWIVNSFPLIWHKSDNSGIAPDPQRWPRRTYETALVAYRGDGKLSAAGPRANSFAHPGTRADAIHISEKPYTMLCHFLSMYCDEYTSILDPTCGSGNVLRVARDLGATSILGLERDAAFAELATLNWSKTNESVSGGE